MLSFILSLFPSSSLELPPVSPGQYYDATEDEGWNHQALPSSRLLMLNRVGDDPSSWERIDRDASAAAELRRWFQLTLQKVDPSPELRPVFTRLRNRWAPSTWRGKHSAINIATRQSGLTLGELLGTYPELASVNFLTGLEDRLAKETLLKSTALRYSRDFTQIMGRIEGTPPLDLALLQDYAKALVRDGAQFPHHLALPMSRALARMLITSHQLSLDLRAGIFVAWKTCSRWDDIHELALPLRYDASQKQILVAFLDNTKASKIDPYECRFFAIVDWSDPTGTQPSEEILRYLTSRRGSLCDQWGTRELENMLRRLNPPTSLLMQPTLVPGQEWRTHYTAHSIKKGAIKHLWENQASANLDPLIIERISKHKNPSGEPLSREAIRYAPDVFPIARYLGTHLASRLL